MLWTCCVFSFFFFLLGIYRALKLFLTTTTLGNGCIHRTYRFPSSPCLWDAHLYEIPHKNLETQFIITNVLMIRSDKKKKKKKIRCEVLLQQVLKTPQVREHSQITTAHSSEAPRRAAPAHPSWWAIILCIMLAGMVYRCDIAFNNVGKFSRQWTFERWISFKRLILMM